MSSQAGTPETADQTQEPITASAEVIRPPRASRPDHPGRKAPAQKSTASQDGKSDGDEPPRKLSLAELFQQGESESETDDDDDDPSKPVDSLARLSKRLKMDPDKVYSIKVPMADGAEPMTIGELKDRVSKMDDQETRETQFEQRRIAAEGTVLRAQQELRDVLSLIPREHLNDKLIQKVRGQHEARVNRERELTYSVIPEWKDEARESADKAIINEHLAEYGYGPEFLDSIIDHRALKYVRDMAMRNKRIVEALKQVQPDSAAKRKTPSAKGSAPKRPNDRQPSVRGRGPQDGLRGMFFNNSSE